MHFVMGPWVTKVTPQLLMANWYRQNKHNSNFWSIKPGNWLLTSSLYGLLGAIGFKNSTGFDKMNIKLKLKKKSLLKLLTVSKFKILSVGKTCWRSHFAFSWIIFYSIYSKIGCNFKISWRLNRYISCIVVLTCNI